MGTHKKLGISKEQRYMAHRYASRFRMFDHKLVIGRRGNTRTLYLEASDWQGIKYRIRFDKVKIFSKPNERQIVNRLYHLKTQCDNVHGLERYSFPNVKNDFNFLDKLPIECKIHGTFYKTKRHLISQEQGCPKCSKIRYNNNRKYYKHEDKVD